MYVVNVNRSEWIYFAAIHKLVLNIEHILFVVIYYTFYFNLSAFVTLSGRTVLYCYLKCQSPPLRKKQRFGLFTVFIYHMQCFHKEPVYSNTNIYKYIIF